MLIRNAEIYGHGRADLRIADGRIAEIGALTPRDGEPLLDAQGGALLPGLHDHHLHLPALASRQASIACGPPEVETLDELRAALTRPGRDWLRGVGYHEAVAGMLDRAVLDAIVPDRPLRIQHRGGRMWFLNSAALDALLRDTPPPPGLDRETGRLFDSDPWLRRALGSMPPALGEVGALLARHGITGVTEMSPANDPAMAVYFAAEQSEGRLPQRCFLSGRLSLAEARFSDRLRPGFAKLHLHEHELPGHDEAIRFIATAHEQGWPVAVHCVTETELVFALSAFDAAGPMIGDRIEHASVAPDALVEEMVRLGLRVVTQPNFVAERGDRYLEDVYPGDIPSLYRLKSLADAGLVLAAGSDAPFGDPDPWAAMRAAVERRTRNGRAIGLEEALSPEEALALFLADPEDLPRQRVIAVGTVADLCLLDRPWAEARSRLLSEDVRATIIGGKLVHER
jgi:predicted amidohydrolase YtcJ